MANGIFNVPLPTNEPVFPYGPGSPERAAVRAQLERLSSRVIDTFVHVGAEEVSLRLDEVRGEPLRAVRVVERQGRSVRGNGDPRRDGTGK